MSKSFQSNISTSNNDESFGDALRVSKPVFSEKFNREMIDALPVMYFILDAEGVILAVNRSGFEQLGYAEKELIGKPIVQIFHPEDRTTFLSHLAEMNENVMPTKHWELRKIRKDGKTMTVSENVRISTQENGEKLFFVVCEDITERKAQNAGRHQLSDLTALVSLAISPKEVEDLIQNLAQEIVEKTSYEKCVIFEFTDENPRRARLRSVSAQFSHWTKGKFPKMIYEPRFVDFYLHEGERIDVGDLGYAVYQPENVATSLQRLVKTVEAFFEKKGHQLEKPLWVGNTLIVPLIAPDNDFYGAIYLQAEENKQTGTPTTEELFPIVTLARQLSQIFANRRATRKLRKQIEREAAINRISNSIRQSLDLQEIFQVVVKEVRENLKIDRCNLFLTDWEARMLNQVAEFAIDEKIRIGKSLLMSPPSEIETILQKQGYFILEESSENSELSALAVKIREDYFSRLPAPYPRTMFIVAIRIGDEIVGILSAAHIYSSRKWSEDDITLAQTIADQAGIAIRQTRLFQQTEANSLRESLINKISKKILSSLSLDDILAATTHELGHALGVSRCYLRFNTESSFLPTASNEYRAPNVAPVTPNPVDISAEAAEVYWRLRKLYEEKRINVIISNLETYQTEEPAIRDYCRLHSRIGDIKSCIYMTLTVAGRFFGTLCLQQLDRFRNWTNDEIELINAVADQLSLAISQAELFESAKNAKLEWESTFTAMTDGVFIFDREGILTRVNQAGASIEKAVADDLIGRKCCSILASATHTPTNCMIDKVLRSGESLTVEFVPLTLRRPLLVTGEPILDIHNEIIGVVCTVRDLYELRQAESIARERQSLLTYILEGVPEPIFATDLEGKILWSNSALTEVTGFSKEELIDYHIFDLIPPDAIEATRDTMREAAEGRSKTAETRYYNRKGELRYAIFDSVPLVVDGKSTGVLMFARDITEQKFERRRIAEADKLRALGQLASGVAHDFNNTLATILGRTQILQHRVTDVESQKSLKIIEKAAADAASVVKRIQTFARKSAVNTFERLNLTALLQDSIEFTRTRWEDESRIRNVSYNIFLENEEPLYINGAASELREIFVNLIFNAIDAMPKGGNIWISCHSEDNAIFVNFTDNGSGMTPEVRERVFEPFFSTKGINGTGLGLSITYNIIKEHKGEISVFSTPDKGTRFEIILPLSEPAESKDKETAKGTENMSYEVLVVDDDNLVRETLVEILEIMTHRVTQAATGAEAIQRLEQQQFDLVLTDFSMRGMSGKDVAQAIRERWNDTKVILISGYGDSIAPQEVPEVDCIVTKPVSIQKLQETIEQLMTRS